MAAAAFALTVTLALAPQAAPRDPTESELADAIASFSNALPSRQEEVAALLRARVDLQTGGSLKGMLAMRDRAVRETKLAARRAPEAFDPVEFAGGLVVRRPVDAESVEAAEKRGLFWQSENQPFLAVRCLYDFAQDSVVDFGVPVAPGGDLFNALHGYVPDSDILLGWVEHQFDFDRTQDLLADYFGHLYADLSGHVYPEITLYDAWSSDNAGHDMPDVDVIAFARKILHDKSYTSPIPAGDHRSKLYAAVSDGFLTWFRYRLWIEAAANLWLNPDAPLRETHEGLRQRLLYVIADAKGDVAVVAKRLAETKTRNEFVANTDRKFAADPAAQAKIDRFVKERHEQGWIAARAAHAVLREAAMLETPKK